jgi:hypothetical protein
MIGLADPSQKRVNMERTDRKIGTPLAQRGSRPVRYELVDKEGRVVNSAGNAAFLAEQAMRLWPDQSQDEDRTGNGWDIQTAR